MPLVLTQDSVIVCGDQWVDRTGTEVRPFCVGLIAVLCARPPRCARTSDPPPPVAVSPHERERHAGIRRKAVPDYCFAHRGYGLPGLLAAAPATNAEFRRGLLRLAPVAWEPARRDWHATRAKAPPYT